MTLSPEHTLMCSQLPVSSLTVVHVGRSNFHFVHSDDCKAAVISQDSPFGVTGGLARFSLHADVPLSVSTLLCADSAKSANGTPPYLSGYSCSKVHTFLEHPLGALA